MLEYLTFEVIIETQKHKQVDIRKSVLKTWSDCKISHTKLSIQWELIKDMGKVLNYLTIMIKFHLYKYFFHRFS